MPLRESAVLDQAALSAVLAGRDPRVVVGIGDDTAVLRPEPGLLLLASDMLVEGTHFTADTMGPADIGWKALAVNLSDVAAMGGRPGHALLSLGLPRATTSDWLRAMFEGLRECAERHGCPLVGGDTVASPLAVLSVAISGWAEKPLLRRGARSGDRLWATGSFGASAAGLHLLLQGRTPPEPLRLAHQRPRPRLAEGQALAQLEWPVATCDASDGLAASARLLAEASGLRALLEADAIPILPETRQVAHEVGKDPLDWALGGGEDYELVFSLPPDREPPFAARAVGRFETGPAEVVLRGPDGLRLLAPDFGWQHFA